MRKGIGTLKGHIEKQLQMMEIEKSRGRVRN